MSRTAIRELAGDLALAVDPQLEFDKAWLESTRDWVVKEIQADTQGSTQREWQDVKTPLLGLANTARIRVQDDLADAITKMIGQMEAHQKKGAGDWNDELPLKSHNLAEHIQLLLSLSSPATSETHIRAHEYLHRQAPSGPTPDELLYQEIMSEGFTGAHWGKGYDEERKHGWTDSEEEDDSDSGEEELITPNSKAGWQGVDHGTQERLQNTEVAERRVHDASAILERLKREAYWKHQQVLYFNMPKNLLGWKAVSGDVPTLVLADSVAKPQRVTARNTISSHQLQREMLYALSGRPGIFFSFRKGECNRVTSHPFVAYWSPDSLNGILDGIGSCSGKLARLRHFTQSTPKSMTVQAFAECCRGIVSDIGIWVGEMERSLVIGVAPNEDTSTSTPLQLINSFQLKSKSLVEYLCELLILINKPLSLLNAIFQFLDATDAETLQDVWTKSSEPVWSFLQNWLTEGMPVPSSLLDSDSQSDKERELSSEFFIRRDQDVAWGDEDFWESAYVEAEEGWPLWLGHGDLKDMILEAGKARGLLMALGEKPNLPVEWKSLEAIIKSKRRTSSTISHQEIIVTAISEHLYPVCALATFQLRRILDEDCGLPQHLDAIEGILYMRHFPVIADWTTWLFKQMDSGNRWTDFHLLTGNLRDCIENNNAEWLNAPAVRVTTTRAQKTHQQTLDSLRATYQAPFPLSQVFSSTSMELRSEVFTFLLRLLHARSELKLSFKDQSTDYACDISDEEKASRQLRVRVSWLLETLWNWIMALIDIEVARYRTRLNTTTSLKAMIGLELDHTRRIRDFCFLHEHAITGREALNVVFDIASKLARSSADSAIEQNAQIVSQALLLRDEVEELASTGEASSTGNEVRDGWSMLVVALQDWR